MTLQRFIEFLKEAARDEDLREELIHQLEENIDELELNSFEYFLRKEITIPKDEIHLCEECKNHIETKIRDEITKIARRNGQLQTTKNSPRCLNQLELHKQKEEASE